jgi:hypothetical protein
MQGIEIVQTIGAAQRRAGAAAAAPGTPIATPRCLPGLIPPRGPRRKKKKRKEKLPEYLKAILDKKLKGKLTHRERITKEAGEQTAKIDEWLKPLDAGYIEAEGARRLPLASCRALLPPPPARGPPPCRLRPRAVAPGRPAGLERTYRFKQEDIVEHVEQGAAKKVFELKLHELGPYSIDFTRNGRRRRSLAPMRRLRLLPAPPPLRSCCCCCCGVQECCAGPPSPARAGAGRGGAGPGRARRE